MKLPIQYFMLINSYLNSCKRTALTANYLGDNYLYDILESSTTSYESRFNWDGQTTFLSVSDTDVSESIDSGLVTSFKDSVVTVAGLRGVQANELLYFEGGASGVALNLEYNMVKILVFGGANSVRTTETVTRSRVVMQVGVGQAILGRIVNPLGSSIDGLGAIEFEAFRPIEQKAPGVITRKKINQPVETGLKVVDALVPIGRGQRELILGDRKTGKTTVAIDAILNQANTKKKFGATLACFYVAIGKRMAEIVRIHRLLLSQGAMCYTALIVARASDPASLQFIAPYAACTMAEYFTYIGSHTLIIYDDLSRHADAYRQISLLLRRPVGREAYPGDIFYLHSRLLERSVMLSNAYGGGSLTALPIVETIQGDVSAYIPTNVISITDGQIYLDLSRHQEGIRPAVDPGLSVSRVGSSAQTKLMKQLAGKLKLELAQFREVEQFSKFGSELDPTTLKLLVRGNLMVNLLKQDRNKPLAISKQIIMFYVTSSKFFEEHVSSNVEIAIDYYFKSLFDFADYVNVMVPVKISFEKQAAAGSSAFKILLRMHFSYFFHVRPYPSSFEYRSAVSAGYRGTLDSGLRWAKTYNGLAHIFKLARFQPIFIQLQ